MPCLVGPPNVRTFLTNACHLDSSLGLFWRMFFFDKRISYISKKRLLFLFHPWVDQREDVRSRGPPVYIMQSASCTLHHNIGEFKLIISYVSRTSFMT